MNFYPYGSFTINSPLQAEEGELHLNNLIAPDYVNPQKVAYAIYDGFVGNGQFELETRKVAFRRTGVYIKGSVLNAEGGSQVMAKARPTSAGIMNILFMVVFESVLIYAMFRDDAGSNFYKVPLFVGLFEYCLIVVLVKYETGIYKRLLLKTLNGKLNSKSD